MERESGISARASHANGNPPPRYLSAFLGALAEEASCANDVASDPRRPWSETNREGVLLLAVAENRLQASEWIARRVHDSLPPPLDSLRYGDMRGCLRLRSAAAKALFPKASKADANFVSACNGCGPAVEMLAFSLCDEGDAAIIPAPYYPTFDSDLSSRARVKPFASLGCEIEELEEAARKAEESGRRARMLLLTQPHNPRGDALDAERMKRAIKWALGRGMHVVSDEIYLRSVYNVPLEDVCTASDAVEAILKEEPGMERICMERVHSIMGLSKDFAASGMRVGFICSRNMELNRVLSGMGYFHSIPGDTQHRVAEMLEDEEFLERFETKNRSLLREAYLKVSEALEQVGVSCVLPVGGLFVWADFRSLLSEPTWEAEDQLYDLLLQEEGILLSPGMAALDDFAMRLQRFAHNRRQLNEIVQKE